MWHDDLVSTRKFLPPGSLKCLRAVLKQKNRSDENGYLGDLNSIKSLTALFKKKTTKNESQIKMRLEHPLQSKKFSLISKIYFNSMQNTGAYFF